MDKKYQEIQISLGSSLENAVNELLSFNEKGKLVYVEFNGVTLYSDTVTMDGAYKAVIGVTKDEFDQEQRKRQEEYERQKKEHKEAIPQLTKEWMEKGREILTEDKWEYWDKIVPIRLNDLYQGMELGNCLDIVKILNGNGSMDEAKEKIENQGHSGMSFGLVCSMIREFCDRGNEFVEYVR